MASPSRRICAPLVCRFGSSVRRYGAGEQMPGGMFRKSEKHASNLADPSGHCTLQQFCAAAGLSHGSHSARHLHQMRIVISAASRSRGGRCIGEALERPDEFDLRLAVGRRIRATSAVIAAGLSHAEYIPQELAQLPGELRSHSIVHRDLSHFKDRDVQPG